MTTTPKTIARTATKKIAAIKSQNLHCVLIDGSSAHGRREADPARAWEALEHGAKLEDINGRYYTVTIHCNLYFKLTPTYEEGQR